MPEASRPDLPDGYGVPADRRGMLAWTAVVDRLDRARNYWLATTRPDGRPHVVVVWGVWLDDALYVGGAPTTRWMRNLRDRPEVAVHLESGDDVVIVEASADEFVPDRELAARLARASADKYGGPADPETTEGVVRLRPRQVLAWTNFPADATRWRFPSGGVGAAP